MYSQRAVATHCLMTKSLRSSGDLPETLLTLTRIIPIPLMAARNLSCKTGFSARNRPGAATPTVGRRPPPCLRMQMLRTKLCGASG
ncbi:hypothetical protein CEXT_764191 [Caerostris extrusa]|uniref:Uncharacterized protein n=1 Tax=Caerostris extrusa TaxID=172846 RepID=A0AAV4X6T4_CAEEX|nr:hypothetical protein CEXT_764191 [Caerostris extrusa]